MTDEELKTLEAEMRREEEMGGSCFHAWPLLAEVKRLRVEAEQLRSLLYEAHASVKSASQCTCDDRPSVPCPMAVALQ